MARSMTDNGSVETLEELGSKNISREARKAFDTGVTSGQTMMMFFRNRRGEKFNLKTSAERRVALFAAQDLVRKGCVPI